MTPKGSSVPRSQRNDARSCRGWNGTTIGPRLVATLAVALFAHTASAALFDDDEARKRIAETNQRLAQVQKQLEDRIAAIETRTAGIVEVSREIELFKADMAKLRGQIEVLVHELAEAQKRQRDLYVDLDSRLRRIESAQVAAPAAAAGVPTTPGGDVAAAASAASPGGAPSPGGSTGAAGTLPPAAGAATGAARPADAAAEQRIYDGALELFKRGDYPGAIAGFTSFVRAYPKSALAPSAQYWIGNAHFARRDYRAAINAQRTLIANYPDSNKVPDALLNIASAQSELGDNAGARRTLEEIVGKHPQSEAATKAKQRLSGRS
jgi:tol-pal system protein YbgF